MAIRSATLLTGTPRLLTFTWMKSEAGDKLEPSAFSRWTCRYPEWKKCFKHVIKQTNKNKQTWNYRDKTNTCTEACEGQRELPHKVIFGCMVMIFHNKSHQSQLRDLQLEAQSAVPSWVETYRGRKRAVNASFCVPFKPFQWIRKTPKVFSIFAFLSHINDQTQ